MMAGVEWLVEAFDCRPDDLTDQDQLENLLDSLVRDLGLNPVGEPLWHEFPPPGGVTGLCLLAESHFACHTYPEHGSMTLNLFTCRPRPQWDFERNLARLFGAGRVVVRKLDRKYMAGVVH